jgi:methanogenic corrinoid protein MtbC1
VYSEKDIARLRWVKSQLETGLTISRAVIAMRSLEADGRLFLPGETELAIRPLLEQPGQNSEKTLVTFPSLREVLLDALTHHDLLRADQLMGEMLAFFSPEDLTLEVIGPVLNAIGEAWEQGQITVADEHLASNYLRHRLLMWMVTGPTPRPGSPILLACAPGEWHEGSLLMLGVLLRRQGWPVAYLGQDLPFQDLAKFIGTITPRAVVLVAMSAGAARALADWPQWITQTGGNPVVAFGGRAFVVQPELQANLPGLYLGNSLQEGMTRLIAILR